MARPNQEIGRRLATLRAIKGSPPQDIVAQKLDVSTRSYQSWEAGDTKPSWRNLSKLAGYYGTSEEFILLGDVIEAIPEPSQLDRIEEQIRLLHAEIATRDAEVLTQIERVLAPTRRSRKPPQP